MARRLKLANNSEALPAGGFSSWLSATREAQVAGEGADVACGTCNACCQSGYFIHITPDELDTLARIPVELQFKAPGLPKGHVLLGYDEKGRCPMLVADRCTIYEDRPKTCRQYDCRVFPATGLAAGTEDKILIRAQTARWRFDHPSATDAAEHEAVRAAASFLTDHAARFPLGWLPQNSTQLAMLAVRVGDLFELVDPGVDERVAAIVARIDA